MGLLGDAASSLLDALVVGVLRGQKTNKTCEMTTSGAAASAGAPTTYLQFLQLLQDHVVGHVVEESVGRREDDVAQLDIERGAVCSIGAAQIRRTHQRTASESGSSRTQEACLPPEFLESVTKCV